MAKLSQQEQYARWISRSIKLKPTVEAKEKFCEFVSKLTFIPTVPALRSQLAQAITEAWVEPRHLSSFTANFLLRQPRVSDALKAGEVTAEHVAVLASDSLVIALLEGGPIQQLTFEARLKAVRRFLLTAATTAADHARDFTDFACALARQCYLNEYVYECSSHEAAEIDALRAALTSGPAPSAFQLAVAAMYFSLYEVDPLGRLLDRDWPEKLADIIKLQVRDAITEDRIKLAIPRLTAILDGVSQKVRQQYEQNPYPRWSQLPVLEPYTFDAWLRRAVPVADVRPRSQARTEILVAGCGTGLQSIMWGKACVGANVLSVDLSLSSLAYAQRRADELEMCNVTFAQADILKLPDLGRSFDYIESTGVLHHMADPFGAWRTLIELVKPGGFMKIGLYSEIARRVLIRYRELVTGLSVSQARQRLLAFENPLFLGRVNDFYTTSEFRDLLLHVQEGQMTLPQIAEFLRSTTDLEFVGFTIGRDTLERYRARFPDDRYASDLHSWHAFELDNPDTFRNMYQFIVRRREI